MPEREDPPQPPFDDDSGECAAEDAERRLILDVVDEQRPLGMRLDDVPVAPAPERPAHLLVFERMRRIVCGVP